MSDYGQQPQQNYSQPTPGYQPQDLGQGYDQQYGAQPQYGMQPQYGYGIPAEHPQAQTVLILSIVGFVVGITWFIGWYMGAQAKKEIEAGAPYRFDGNLKVGYMLSKIMSIVSIVSVALVILLFIAAIALGMSSY